MTVTVEEQRVRALFGAADKAGNVAYSLPEGDVRRSDLLDVSHAVLAEVATVRVIIAAKILGLSEKTIRTWANQGVLTVTEREPRLLLDAASVYEVSHFIRQLRAAGRNRDLLDEIGRHLHDRALIEDDDFQESLAEMRRGEVEVLRPLPKPDKNGR
jgi:DNA-binding transcriptional MerR regulator